MESMKTFSLWFIEQLPEFLMADPVIYFVGLAFGLLVIGLFKSLINIKK